VVLDGVSAAALVKTLRGSIPWEVTGVDEKPFTQHPAPPFITSSLQQEGNRKFGFSADRTMSAAQKLFDNGVISYHRTDSTTLSDKALQDSGRTIRGMYGDAYYGGPRRYQKKVKNAQEAHEAIRPTDFSLTPEKAGSRFHADEARVYELIRRASLPEGELIDSITLETALRLLSLPREIGPHPEDGAPVESNFGPFGPYVKHGDDFRSLESKEQVYSITLDDAVELLRQPKRARKRTFGGAKATPLNELGTNPAGAAIKVFDGRYGPYISDGVVNATVPKGVSLESITLESALELLAEKAAKGPSKRPAKKSRVREGKRKS
jgi:hypothetical protein